MMLFLQFLFAFGATAGFTLIFNIPRRHIFFAGFSGACGWVLFQYLLLTGQSIIISSFLASCLIAALSELFSRVFKEASLIFIIPGILPLVPGAGMYKTMLALLKEDHTATAQIGTETLLMTGAIAVAIIIVSSFVRAVTLLMTSDRLR